MTEIITGLLALAVPAFLIGSIVLWRTRPVLLMYYALVLVGLGYLTTTGAVEDVGREALTYIETREATPAAGAPQPAAASAEPAAAPASAAPTAPAQSPATEAAEAAPAPATDAPTPPAAPAP